VSAETIRARRLNPNLGAEISGIDLSQPLSNSEVAALHDALHEHQVIFFRNTSPIDPGALVRLGRHFGDLHSHVMGGLPDHPEVRRLHADETSKHVAGEDWHTDSTCDPIPPLGSILYLHTLPPLGGDTIFASMYAAYDALSPRMKDYLSGLTATHDGALVFNRFSKDKKYPVSVHPVITKHPATGRKVIFVNRSFTSHINELPERESKAVLNFLYDHLESPLYQMRFHWEPHSIAFWDNRCTQHYAVWDYYPAVRSGFRVQIEGQKPIAA
jgi:alpha-ketoglutarate-dependent taurine dioxygenase